MVQKLAAARRAETQAIALADDGALLLRWLREDILAVAGPDLATRQHWYDCVVAELRSREPWCPQRLRPVRVLPEKQRDDLLAFVAPLDADLAAVAAAAPLPLAVVRELLDVQALDVRDARRWPRQARLRQQLRERFHRVSVAVGEVARQVVRASSVSENRNSRLRNYCFLRRHLGADYLAWLQFFLNHRRFLRSAHPERVERSPADLLTGDEHAHWLELLGYQRFRRN